MTIYAFVGNMGAGKSHTCVEKAIAHAEKYDKFIVSNFGLNMEKLEEYCHRKKYRRLLRKVSAGLVFFDDDFTRMCSYERSVLLADEIGILLNRRTLSKEWHKYKKFFSDLCQIRKAGNDLFWMAQHLRQVDHDILNVTNHFYHMNSWMGVWKMYSLFNGPDYLDWLTKPTFKARWKRQMEMKIRKFDQFLFEVYDTNHRFDRSKSWDPRLIAQLLEDPRSHDNYEEDPSELVPGWVNGERAMVPVVRWNPAPRPTFHKGMIMVPDGWVPDEAAAPAPVVQELVPVAQVPVSEFQLERLRLLA